MTVGEVAVPAGYSATIHCGPTREAPQPYTGGPFPVTSPPVDGATLTCTITNIQLFSTVRVVKAWIGDPASATIFVDQNGAAPFDASTVATATGDSASFVYPVDTPVTVGEVEVPAGYSASIHCGPTLELPQPYSGGPFPVTSPLEGGAHSHLHDHQHAAALDRARRQGMGWSVLPRRRSSSTRTGWRPTTPPPSRPPAARASSFEYPVSTPVAVGETPVPAGFTAAIDCGGGPQAYAGGPFPVTSPAVDGATITCTITNTPVTTVRVLKEWGGAARSATIFVDDVGRAPLDVASVTTADGQSVSFDYPPSTQVTIGEIRVPQGYLAVINCGTGPRDLRLYRGGPFTVTTPSTPGGVLTCTVTNVQRPGPLAVLVLDKASNRRVVSPNQRVTFRITVRNRGRGTARNVITCDRMPAGLRVVSAPGARRSGRNLCWRVASMRPNTKRTFKVVARVGPSSRRRVIVNPADVIASNTLNCRNQAAARRLRVCRDRVPLVLRASGVAPARVARVPFTG